MPVCMRLHPDDGRRHVGSNLLLSTGEMGLQEKMGMPK